MSQFNSLRGRGNYANAGRTAANNALRSFIAARKNSPNYSDLAIKGAQLRSAEKLALLEIKSELAERKFKIDAAVEVENIKKDALSEIAGNSRMAGKIAAAGQKVGYGLFKLGAEKEERRDSSLLIDSITESEAKARAKAKEIQDGIITPLTTSNTNNLGNQQGSDQPGKVNTSASSPIAANTSNMSDGWQRLSRVLSVGEGTEGDKGYTTRYGGHQFTLGKDHPRISAKTPWGSDSAAAGKYQIMPDTWDTVVQPALNLPDFSIESQEKAGRYLTQNRGVDPDKVYTNFDDFKAAIDKLAPEWASMPYSKRSPTGFGMGSSYYGQGGIDIYKAWEIYNQ